MSDESTPVPLRDFSSVRIGDIVVRMLAGIIPMDMTVVNVDDILIHCVGGWAFDRKTGVEVDEVLGFGPHTGLTGSFLTEVKSIL